MVRRSKHRKRGIQLSTVFKPARVAMVIILLATPLGACGPSQPEEPPREVISLPKDVLPSKNVLDVVRKDTDTDGHEEWVVFYRFDQVGGGGPVAALIYDVVSDPSSLLPLAYPYKLRTPHEDYLAQGQPEVTLVDIVTESSGTERKEVLFKTANELVFFQVNGNLVNQPRDDPPLYRCIGFFRSRDGVSFNPENLEVAVTSRDEYERSQLVTRRYYKPAADGYFITGTTMLVSPFESAVDFPEGIPTDILGTPYPEKIVLAFYKTFGKADAKPTILEYLSAQAADEFMQGKLKYGSPWPLGELKWAVVKELSYYPTGDASQSAVVIVKVVFHRTTGEKSPLIEVRWTLIRVQNQWKMHYPES